MDPWGKTQRLQTKAKKKSQWDCEEEAQKGDPRKPEKEAQKGKYKAQECADSQRYQRMRGESEHCKVVEDQRAGLAFSGQTLGFVK